MKIRVEVSQAELDEMDFDSVGEFKDAVLRQLDDGVVGADGEAGTDWLTGYQLEVVKV